MLVITWKVKVAQSGPTLCHPMDYTVHGILQARILEWVTFPFSRGSSQSRVRTQVSCMKGEFFTSCVTREAPEQFKCIFKLLLYSTELRNWVTKLLISYMHWHIDK